jgi:predicted RNA binding protein YcfA (HicA-like mRNA interferase family)
MTETGTTDPEVLAKCLTDLGFTLGHIWYESHGDGSHRIFQAPNSDATMVMVVSRGGQASGLFPGQRADYRLAKEMLAQIAEDKAHPDERPRYTKIETHVSACCTSQWTDYKDGTWGDVYRILQVAGHGDTASKLR